MYIELNIKEQQIGDWSIKSLYDNDKKYQQLLFGQEIKMANTPDIVADYIEFLNIAEGNILINGLGIGMCVAHLLKKQTTKHITVIELNESIFQLVTPYFKNNANCTLVCGNAFNFEPSKGTIYDYVWHDIWTYITADNVKQAEHLFNKYKNIAKWQGAWNLDKAQKQLNIERNNKILN